VISFLAWNTRGLFQGVSIVGTANLAGCMLQPARQDLQLQRLVIYHPVLYD